MVMKEGPETEEFGRITDGWFYDEECGSVTEGIGWAGIVRGPFSDTDMEGLSPEDKALLRSAVGLIVECDTQGFYSWEAYYSQESLEDDWQETVEDLEGEPEEE